MTTKYIIFKKFGKFRVGQVAHLARKIKRSNKINNNESESSGVDQKFAEKKLRANALLKREFSISQIVKKFE
jgi:hypothetical protein